jgi:hypothetical protein
MDPADLGQRLLQRPAVVEVGAVVELNAIPRIDRDEVDVVFAFFAEQGEQLVEQKVGGDDGGPGVEDESVAMVSGAAAAELGLFVDDGDGIPAGGAPRLSRRNRRR